MTNIYLKRVFPLFLFLTTVSLGAQQSKSHRFEASRYLDYFSLIYKNVDVYYVDSVAPEKAIRIGIDAMLNSLDPYTEFYPEEDASNLDIVLSGNYGGIGAMIMQYKGGQVCISEPYEGQPAAEAGLRAGDIILEVDGTVVKGMTTKDVSSRLRGTHGTTVSIKVQRVGEAKPIEVKVVRRSVQLSAVPYYNMYDGGVGYINLSTFTSEPAKEFKRAFLDLKTRGITSLIIDLRGNGGGLLNEAVEIAGYFLPRGTEIVSTRKRGGIKETVLRTTSAPLDTEIPIVVMIDETSASASEIVAGAFQDLDRAVLVGQRTFGKGLVQNVTNLPYGAALKLTTSKYYTPSGRCVQRIDYAHPDSTAVITKDSGKEVYYTKSGRQVYGKGGVLPDSVLTADIDTAASAFLAYLNPNIDTLHLVLDFANQYRAAHKSIVPAAEFELSDSDFEAFLSLLQERGFSYTTYSNNRLQTLIEAVKAEGYEQEAEEHIAALQKMFAADFRRDAQKKKDLLKRFLSDEIVKRYYYQKGALEYFIKHDKEFQQARSIIVDKEKMASLLRP